MPFLQRVEYSIELLAILEASIKGLFFLPGSFMNENAGVSVQLCDDEKPPVIF